jgi:hypothetical protein
MKMDALEMFDRLEDKALASAKKRLAKLTAGELLTLWGHYFPNVVIPTYRADTIRQLAIELVMDGK